MSFAETITRMTKAVERGDGKAVAECFTSEGIYHDVFYGSFKGADIADMVDNYFHRDGTNFRWDLHDPVEQNGMAYVRYVFSYEAKTDYAMGKRVLFEGISIVRMDGDLIADYREVANAAVGLLALGFSPERAAKFVTKQADELKSRDEAKGHLG